MGFVQPVGLVVAPTVLVAAQVFPDENIAPRQREFRQLLEESGRGPTARWRASDVRKVFLEWLGWSEGDLIDSETERGDSGNIPARVTSHPFCNVGSAGRRQE